MLNTDSGLDVEKVRRRLAGRVVGGTVAYHPVLGSTMDEARRLAEDGCAEGAVVVAEEQTGGRGRFNRSWLSPLGSGLTFSVVLRPEVCWLPYVNMAAALAVRGAAAELTGLTPAIKWPNDVRIGGKKIAGILVEAALEGADGHAIVGVGLNVNMDVSKIQGIEQTATSLSAEAGRPFDRTDVLVAVLERLDEACRLPGAALLDRWRSALDTLGQHVRVRSGERSLEGEAVGVDDRGSLVLQPRDGPAVTLPAGEVTLQAPASGQGTWRW